jgi:hypothetical protein
MPSSAQRSPSDWHTSLKAFEADRRTKYQSNVETLDLYWKSHCELIEASVHETARAYRLVLGISKAHERMAVTLGKTVQSSQSQSSVTSSVSAPWKQMWRRLSTAYCNAFKRRKVKYPKREAKC